MGHSKRGSRCPLAALATWFSGCVQLCADNQLLSSSMMSESLESMLGWPNRTTWRYYCKKHSTSIPVQCVDSYKCVKTPTAHTEHHCNEFTCAINLKSLFVVDIWISRDWLEVSFTLTRKILCVFFFFFFVQTPKVNIQTTLKPSCLQETQVCDICLFLDI